jgi:[acyl-carrier-protein] S-malonyltransferase
MLTPEYGFKIIKARAEAMEDMKGGSMYAVLKCDPDVIKKVCYETEGYVMPANYNSPVQTVISGEDDAVLRAVDTLTNEHKARCVKLNVSAAFHTDLMRPASEVFYNAMIDMLDEYEEGEENPDDGEHNGAIARFTEDDQIVLKHSKKGLTFKRPTVKCYSNLMGRAIDDYFDIPSLLKKHMVSPVLFTQELQAMREDGYDTFVEIGPGKVLSGLVKKTLKDVRTFNIEDLASFEATCKALVN